MKTLTLLRVRIRLWILKSLFPTFETLGSAWKFETATEERLGLYNSTYEEDYITIMHIILIMPRGHCAQCVLSKSGLVGGRQG